LGLDDHREKRPPGKKRHTSKIRVITHWTIRARTRTGTTSRLMSFGFPEKEQRNDDTKIDLEKWDRTSGV
jgi:hypothetical protein